MATTRKFCCSSGSADFLSGWAPTPFTREPMKPQTSHAAPEDDDLFTQTKAQSALAHSDWKKDLLDDVQSQTSRTKFKTLHGPPSVTSSPSKCPTSSIQDEKIGALHLMARSQTPFVIKEEQMFKARNLWSADWECVPVSLYSDFTLVYFENPAARLLGNEAGRIALDMHTTAWKLPEEGRFEVRDGTKRQVWTLETENNEIREEWVRAINMQLVKQVERHLQEEADPDLSLRTDTSFTDFSTIHGTVEKKKMEIPATPEWCNSQESSKLPTPPPLPFSSRDATARDATVPSLANMMQNSQEEVATPIQDKIEGQGPLSHDNKLAVHRKSSSDAAGTEKDSWRGGDSGVLGSNVDLEPDCGCGQMFRTGVIGAVVTTVLGAVSPHGVSDSSQQRAASRRADTSSGWWSSPWKWRQSREMDDWSMPGDGKGKGESLSNARKKHVRDPGALSSRNGHNVSSSSEGAARFRKTHYQYTLNGSVEEEEELESMEEQSREKERAAAASDKGDQDENDGSQGKQKERTPTGDPCDGHGGGEDDGDAESTGTVSAKPTADSAGEEHPITSTGDTVTVTSVEEEEEEDKTDEGSRDGDRVGERTGSVRELQIGTRSPSETKNATGSTGTASAILRVQTEPALRVHDDQDLSEHGNLKSSGSHRSDRSLSHRGLTNTRAGPGVQAEGSRDEAELVNLLRGFVAGKGGEVSEAELEELWGLVPDGKAIVREAGGMHELSRKYGHKLQYNAASISLAPTGSPGPGHRSPGPGSSSEPCTGTLGLAGAPAQALRGRLGPGPGRYSGPLEVAGSPTVTVSAPVTSGGPGMTPGPRTLKRIAVSPGAGNTVNWSSNLHGTATGRLRLWGGVGGEDEDDEDRSLSLSQSLSQSEGLSSRSDGKTMYFTNGEWNFNSPAARRLLAKTGIPATVPSPSPSHWQSPNPRLGPGGGPRHWQAGSEVHGASASAHGGGGSGSERDTNLKPVRSRRSARPSSSVPVQRGHGHGPHSSGLNSATRTVPAGGAGGGGRMHKARGGAGKLAARPLREGGGGYARDYGHVQAGAGSERVSEGAAMAGQSGDQASLPASLPQAQAGSERVSGAEGPSQKGKGASAGVGLLACPLSLSQASTPTVGDAGNWDAAHWDTFAC